MRQIKVDDDVHDKLKEIAEKRQISINDLVRELLNIYLGGFVSEKAIDKVVSREFVADSTKYCSRCRREIKQGDVVYWVKFIYSDGSAKTMYFCIECHNPYLGKVYRRKRELEITIKQLKQEADKLVEEINQMETVRDFYKLKADIMQFWKAFKDVVVNEPDVQKVNEFFDKLLELVDKVSKLEAVVEELARSGLGDRRAMRRARSSQAVQGTG